MNTTPMGTTTWTVPSWGGLDCFRAVAWRQRYARHRHECLAIGVFEEGVGGTEYRGSLSYIAPGQVVAMNPDEAHTGFAADGAMTYRMFYLTDAAASLISPGRPARFREVCISNTHWAGQLFMLHKQLERGEDVLAGEVRGLEILSGFFRTFGGAGEPAQAGPEPRAVGRIKEYIRAQHARNVSIEELVAVSGLSRAYLIRAFRRSVGMPPHTWLLQLRVDRACQMLAEGRAIADVALETGFADQSHLTRRFRSIIGLTPAQFAARRSRPKPSD